MICPACGFDNPEGTTSCARCGGSPSPAAPESNPVQSRRYRRVFVGREEELGRLHAAFDSAASGQGSLIMVAGEPGIGKTALCQQLASYVDTRDGKILTGHCYEEGSLSLPYLPFVEALRSHVLSREPEDLKRELGSGAEPLSRIVPEVREKVQFQPRERASPEEERFRLMQSVTDFLSSVAEKKLLLLILEDLHDADKDTLSALTHLARNLSDARLLVVGTYRDVEVDREHPLSAALAELRRAPSFDRVLLWGLTRNQVRRIIETVTSQQ
ncbi:MAG: AAA family ATPase, partial [Dehalococcoidia bacterium]